MTKQKLKQELRDLAREWWFSTNDITLDNLCKELLVTVSNHISEPREKQIKQLEQENEQIKTRYYKLQDTLKKVRLALIKERTANIMNYGKGGVEMFDDLMEILKGNGEI